MDALLASLRAHLDSLPPARRYAAAARALEADLGELEPLLETLCDDREGRNKRRKALRDWPDELRQPPPPAKACKRMWKLAADLFDEVCDDPSQVSACGAAEALAWICVVAMADQGLEVGFHYERFDGMDCPEPPHLVEVFRRLALARAGLAAFAPGEDESLDAGRLQPALRYLEGFTRAVGV